MVKYLRARGPFVLLQLPGKLTQVFEDRMAKGHIFGVNIFVTNGSQKIDLAAILAGN